MLQEQLQQHQQKQQQQNAVNQRRQSNGMSEFKKLTPPSFEGATDPLEAEK